MSIFEKKEKGIPRRIIELNAQKGSARIEHREEPDNDYEYFEKDQYAEEREERRDYTIVNQNIINGVRECTHNDDEDEVVDEDREVRKESDKLQKVSFGAVILAQAVNIFMRVFGILNDIDPKDTK